MKGSVVKKGTKFYIVVDAGRDALGKRKQRWISGFNTKKEAERELPRVLVKLQDGELLENNKSTLGEFADEWFKNKIKRDELAPTTADGYRNIIYKHFIPTLGDIKLQDLKPYSLQKYFDIKYEDLAARTLSNHRKVIKSILLHAVDMELIQKNPLDKVKLPRGKKKEVQVYNAKETIELLDMVRDEKTIGVPVALAILLGIRRGEALGLRWSDIDFENKRIHISQALTIANGRMYFGEPKTDKSKRDIAMPDMLIPILKEHKKWQMKMMLRTGNYWKNEHNLVCTSVRNGGPMRPNVLSDCFRRFLQKYDMKQIPYHSLRHTHSSLLITNNVPVKLVSNRLGHSNTTITLETYTHVLRENDEVVAEKLNELLAK